jgi:hypothetical protein
MGGVYKGKSTLLFLEFVLFATEMGILLLVTLMVVWDVICSPMILNGPFDVDMQIRRRPQCKVRIPQKLPRREDNICISIFKDLLVSPPLKLGLYFIRLSSVRNETDGSNGQPRNALLDGSSKRDLESRGTRNALLRMIPA